MLMSTSKNAKTKNKMNFMLNVLIMI